MYSQPVACNCIVCAISSAIIISILIIVIIIYVFPPCCNSPQWARASSLSRLCDYTRTHHILQDSCGQVINHTHRPLPDNTEHLRRDSNPQFQQSDGGSTTSQTARPPELTIIINSNILVLLQIEHVLLNYYYFLRTVVDARLHKRIEGHGAHWK